jgi:hypothetical protein
MHSDVQRRLRSVARLVLLSGLALASVTAPARAQEEAVVEQLAPVLAAEDARNFEPALFRSALVSPDSLVRRLAAMAAGRIGDLRATPLLIPLLSEPDSTVRVAAAFALGLIRDTAGAQPLMDRITGLPPLDAQTAQEAITALAKIGGPRVGRFFEGILGGSIVPSREDRRPLLGQIVLESWRLGADAPVGALLPFLEDTAAGMDAEEALQNIDKVNQEVKYEAVEDHRVEQRHHRPLLEHALLGQNDPQGTADAVR